MNRIRVTVFDVGSLCCDEAVSLIDSPITVCFAVGEELKELARIVLRGRKNARRFGESIRCHFALSRKSRLLRRMLIDGTAELHLLLMDPQLQPDGVRKLKSLCRSIPNIHVYALPTAVTGGGEFRLAKLYLTGESDLLGSSLFSTKSNVRSDLYTWVPCVPLVEVIKASGLLSDETSHQLNILRMNAEGIEDELLRALDSARLLSKFDMLMGAGHDLRKIDKHRYAEYIRFLDERGLKFMPFKATDRGAALMAIGEVERRLSGMLCDHSGRGADTNRVEW